VAVRPKTCLRSDLDSVSARSTIPDWVRQVIDACQHLAGAATERYPGLLLSDLAATLETVPDAAAPVDVAVVRDVLGRTIGRIIRGARLENQGDVAQALVRVIETPATGPWRKEFSRLMEICAVALVRDAGPSGDAGRPFREGRATRPNWYVRETLQFIDAHYGEPTCALSHVAAVVRLTPSHLSRILTRQTGEGFVAHLRRRRVVEAERLLRARALCIKEVATAVGYETSRQLERDVKRVWRVTPTSLRKGSA